MTAAPCGLCITSLRSLSKPLSSESEAMPGLAILGQIARLLALEAQG